MVINSLMVKKSKKINKKKAKESFHYCLRCRKRTAHKGAGIRWVRYSESCTVCGSINYEEFQR